MPNSLIDINDAYFIRGTLISVELLEKKIVEYLELGYVFTTVSDMRENQSDNIVVLTFDDGYLDNYTYVKPVLEKYNVKATFYPIVGYCKEQKVAPLDVYYHYINQNVLIENKRSWIVGKRKKKFLDLSIQEQNQFVQTLFNTDVEVPASYMNDSHIIELQNLGHEIGGHSYYHDIYTKLNKDEILRDIQKTKKAFLQIGIDIKSYAYTDGQYNTDVIHILKKENIDYSCAIKSKNLMGDCNYEIEREFVAEDRLTAKELFGIELSSTELNEFLFLIGVFEVEDSLSFLKSFIVKLLATIPFQNFKMIQRGFGYIPTAQNIKEDMLYLNGGTCATMNVFTATILHHIGFNVFLINGTMMRKNDHIAILLNFKDLYYTIDVGDGQPYFEPIPILKKVVRKHPFRTYRSFKDSGDLKVEFLIKKMWSTDVTLHLKPKLFKDIYETLEQHYTESEFGPFWKGVRFAMYPNKEIIAIRNKSLIVQTNDSIHKTTIINREHLKALLQNYLPLYKEQIFECFLNLKMF
jgi:peptidoglycan/xylan/chitin deacetylase (PgdA/CDA1 family)/arylamine N-acetyltransferase